MIKRAREVLRIEAKAISDLGKRLDSNFEKAVDLVVKCRGRVVVTGMGKGGIIGQKISSTLASLGSPSLWLHSAEAIHGDLGRITPLDVIIAISNSGETQEVKDLLPQIKKIGAKIIAITGNIKSTLAKYSDAVLDTAVKKEACSLGLAPTSSTTAMLAMGDALAVCVVEKKGFKKEDFAFLHPGGSLGKRLLLTVEDIMRKGRSNCVVSADTNVKDTLLSITSSRAGAAAVVDNKGKLLGIFTDGDLRRHLEVEPDLTKKKVKEVMTKNPVTINKKKLAYEALQILREKRIDELPVIDDSGRPAGMLDVQDLLKAGLV